jgi:hypothetical protein
MIECRSFSTGGDPGQRAVRTVSYFKNLHYSKGDCLPLFGRAFPLLFAIFAPRGVAMTDEPKTKKADQTQVMATDAPTAIRRDVTPTIFADGLLGGSIESGVVRLELLARHLDSETKSLNAALVGRLVMPADRFAAFVAALLELVKKIQAAQTSNP